MKLIIEGEPAEIDAYLSTRHPVRYALPDRKIKWSEEEREPLKGAPDYHTAWDRYHARFPDSHRKKDDIRKQWLWLKTAREIAEKKAAVEQRPAKPDISAGGLSGGPAAVPAEIPKAPAAKMPAAEKAKQVKKTRQRRGPAKGNSFGIPSELARTDLKKYQRLWFRCSKKGIMYEEALKMEKGPVAKKERLPYKLKNKKPEALPAEERVTRYAGDDRPNAGSDEGPFDPPMEHDDTPGTYTVKGLDKDLADAMPEERPPTGHEEKKQAAKTMETIRIGDKVRQIGGLKICAGIGEIKRAPPGNPEVLVAFGNGQEWISRKNLAPVSA